MTRSSRFLRQKRNQAITSASGRPIANFCFIVQATLFLLFLLAFVTGVSGQVILHLKSGDRVTGTVVSETADSVTIKTSFAGNITVRASEIERRVSTNSVTNNPPAAPAAPPPATVPKPAPAAPAPILTSTNQAASLPKPPSAFDKFLDEWSGEVELGLNLGFSTKDRQTYSGRARAVHAHTTQNQRVLRNSLDYIFSYGRTDGTLVDNRMDGSLKTEYELGKRFLVYNAVGVGYDEVRSIDLQYDLGPGIGYKLITRTNFVLKTEFGGNYQKQFLANDEEKDRYSLRFAEEAWWQISSKIRLDEKVEFFPEITDPSDFRIRAEANLSYQFQNNLALKLTVIDLYETSPARGVSNNDLQIRSSLGFKF